MLTPSKLWPATALDVEVKAVAPTTGVATPLCFLLLPCSSELLRSAGASSPRRLSGSMMLLSGKAETVAGCGPEAPAAPANATAAVAARDKTTTACQKLFKCMLPPSVDLLRGRTGLIQPARGERGDSATPPTVFRFAPRPQPHRRLTDRYIRHAGSVRRVTSRSARLSPGTRPSATCAARRRSPLVSARAGS